MDALWFNAFVIAPVILDDDFFVSSRLRPAQDSALWSGPSAHRAFRSREASVPW